MTPREEPETKSTNNRETHSCVCVQPHNPKSTTRQAFFCNIYAKTKGQDNFSQFSSITIKLQA